MNAEQLLHHFDQIADAPDAVACLRRFILDLAVRGKLVEQNSSDEPASELLKRVEGKRAQFLKENKLQAISVLDPIGEDELLFSIPAGWQVMRMGWLAQKLGAGSTPLGGKSVYQSEGVPFLRSQNVHDDGLRLDDVALIPQAVHERMSGTHIQQQDILLNITGASIGRCALVPNDFVEGNVSQHVAIIRLFEPAIREFIHLSLISPSYQKLIMDVQVGVSREGLSMQNLKLFPMVIPPLAEQQRIVAKVDELMALCDELEAARAQRETRRDQLVAATLHSLANDRVGHGAGVTNGPGATNGFAERARFYFNHLPRLTTRPEHIKQLRQTLLNLAVRGKLVPQDPNDEPASEALARIAHAKSLLSKSSKTADQPVVRDIDGQRTVPSGWEAIQLEQILVMMQTGPFGSTLHQQDYELGGTPVINPASIQNERIVPIEKMAVGKKTLDRLAVYKLRERDVVMGRRGEMGRSAVVTEREAGWMCGSGSLILRFTDDISPWFIVKLLAAPSIRTYLGSASVGATMQNLNQSILRDMPIGLPPLAEQHRIVAKVDELMALCDALEAQLTTNAATRRQLLEATLHAALVGQHER